MLWSKQPGGRWLALALLVAVAFGPAGMGAVSHPADDAACAARQGPWGDDFVGDTLTGPSVQGPHCLACHLLRSVRWAASPAPAPSPIPEATVVSFDIDSAPVANGTHLTTPGRSPPMTSRLSG